MNNLLTWRPKRGFLTGAAIGLAGLLAILLLAQTVARDLRLLNSASSDNLQWTLAQTEVEFLEFDRYLSEAEKTGDPNLPLIRRRFDIFYSRISTLEKSSIFTDLRELPEFQRKLHVMRDFLDDTVGAIDSDDAGLTAAIPALQKRAAAVRMDVRGLSNSGLDFFAQDADRRRQGVAVSLLQLAGVAVLLMLLLAFLATYLGYLNALNLKRRKEADQANDRLKIVIENSLEGVIVADAKGCILDFNAAAEEIFGYSAEEAIGQNLGALVVPDHLVESHNAGMKRIASGGERRVVGAGRVKLEAKRSNGENFPVELAVQSARRDDGEVFVAFMRDLTPEVKAEAELVTARDLALAGEKAKTDFLAVMSHEIRTPLNGLLGNLTLLQDTSLNSKQSQYVANMETSGRLLMSHITNVLDLTKYESNAQAVRPVAMNLCNLIQDIIDNQSGPATAQGTALSWGWRGTAVDWINADRERIQHVLINLIGNAVKFTQKGHILVVAEGVETAPSRLDIKIGIRDTGIGISADLLKTIFDDFVTGDASYVREVGGTGLGLGIARRLIEGMGGEIGVESKEGEGSNFWVRFPAETIASPENTITSDVQQSHAGNLEILLVEDNDINMFVAREMLVKAGHRVTEARNGQESVDIAQHTRFDLIFMDISMPVMDGPTAAQNIRAGNGLSADTPIIALTANVMLNEQQEFLAKGMNAVLTKPLRRSTLTEMVSRFSSAEVASVETKYEETIVPEELQGIIGATEFTALMERLTAETRTFCEGASFRDLLTGATPDYSTLKADAHKLAGSAAFLAAEELHRILIGIETAAARADLQAVASFHSELTNWLSEAEG